MEQSLSLVKDARNSALHEGAKARHLTEHAIRLALVLEEALRRMPDELATVADLMVRSPVIADVWQPMSFARQAMLTNSFSFLPVLIGATWKLLSDHFVAHYLHKAVSNNQRRELLGKCVQKGIEESPEMPLATALTILDTSSISDLLKLSPIDERGVHRPDGALSAPILVLDSERLCRMEAGQEGDPRELLVGIITAFDLL